MPPKTQRQRPVMDLVKSEQGDWQLSELFPSPPPNSGLPVPVTTGGLNLSPLLGQKIGLFKVDSSPPEIEKMNHHQGLW